MTPAINLLKKLKVNHTVHEYQHDPGCESYGQEAADKLGVEEARVFKTLVIQQDNLQLAVAVLPVSARLSMKKIAKALGIKKAVMAQTNEVLKSTGYVLGGVSPLGQKKRLATVIDDTATNYGTIYVSGGRRGLDIELSPDDLGKVLKAVFAGICQ
jgi:Cys-tRNA(Pro)/Cys-tRNA(Cys) deacylase